MSLHLYESFLYQHYRLSRSYGNSHMDYVILNDLDHETARELEIAYIREQRVNRLMESDAVL